MKTQLSTVVPPSTRQAFRRLAESTGHSLTDLLTLAVSLRERHFHQAGLGAGYIPWIAVLANGATCAPICTRCATSE
jgi:hypothetical protein